MSRQLPATVEELVPLLSKRIMRMVKNAGIKTPEQLFSTRYYELLKIKGFGRTSLSEVQYVALQYGRRLPQPGDPVDKPAVQFVPPLPPSLKEDPTMPKPAPVKEVRTVKLAEVVNFILHEGDAEVVRGILGLCTLKLDVLRRK